METLTFEPSNLESANLTTDDAGGHGSEITQRRKDTKER